MIVKRFKLDDLKDIAEAGDFYKALGFGKEEFADKDKFGNKPYYKNFFVHPETSEAIKDILDSNVGVVADELGSKTRARIAQHLDWFNFAPVSNGPRYDEMVEACGRIIHNALYILEPTDLIFEEAPDV